MVDHEDVVQGSDFRDCKTGLFVFGILEVSLGVFCALMVPLVIFGMIVTATLNDSSAAPMSTGMMIPSMLIYVILAVWFIWMGIGSMKARRWARSLLLVTSWIWLVWGIMVFIYMLVLMPDMYDQMNQSGEIPSGMVAFMKYMMFAFMAGAYVIIPGALVLFYGRKNVKATCEFMDPQVRWTDKCPLPVLAVSLMCGLWAGSMLLMGLYGWAIPFFGRILSGVTGAGVAIVGILLLSYAAWSTYRLNIRGWWCTVFVTIGWAISTGMTFSRVSMLEYYEKMNFPEQQMEIMKQYDMPPNSTMVIFFGVWVVGFLGYLLYTRRYFTSPSSHVGIS